MLLPDFPRQSKERGFIIIFVALLFITLAGIYLFKPKFGPTNQSTNACLNPAPNRTLSFDFGSSVNLSPLESVFPRIRDKADEEPYRSMVGNYQLIRTVTAIPESVFPFHFGKAGQVEYGGKTRQIYVVLTHCDGIIPSTNTPNDCAPGDSDKVAAVNFRTPDDELGTNAFNLLLIDVSDDPAKVPNPMPGFIYTEIYIKQGGELPKFIEDFCQQFQGTEAEKALNPILIFVENNQSHIPPLKVDLEDNSKLTTEYPRTDLAGNDSSFSRLKSEGQILAAKFDLIAYAPITSYIVESQGIKPSDFENTLAIKGIYRDGDKDYYLGFVSFARFIVLIDKDNPQNVYYYRKLDNDRNFSNTPAASPDKSLQLKTFVPISIQPLGWWTPECKPAIYLYPEKSQQVSVKVFPKGHLTFTDPLYPEDGWKITAHPDGSVVSGEKIYPYLYYESKIMDGWIKKPTEGFVVAYADLPKLYSDLLPKLGLSDNETADFKEYWEKALTSAPFYFVGIMDEKSIEMIEPLEINPEPDSTIRVRLYFQALDESFKIKAPNLSSIPKREGFSVVEWGGLVKNNPDHPFTCSQ